MNNNWIKTYVIQILPAISIIVYILGFTYSLTYYYEFGINILSYITFDEVLVSSLIPIAFIIIINMINLVTLLLISPGIRLLKREVKKNINKYKNNKRINRIISQFNIWKKNFKIRRKYNTIAHAFAFSIVTALSCIIIPYLIYTDYIYIEKYKYYILAITSVAYSSCITMYIIKKEYFRFVIIRNIVLTFTFSVNFICLIIVIILTAHYNAEKDKIATKNIDYEIITENGINYNNEKYNYINDCSNAIFLYERSTKETIIIPSNHILSIRHKGINKTFYHKVIDDVNSIKKQNIQNHNDTK